MSILYKKQYVFGNGDILQLGALTMSGKVLHIAPAFFHDSGDSVQVSAATRTTRTSTHFVVYGFDDHSFATVITAPGGRQSECS